MDGTGNDHARAGARARSAFLSVDSTTLESTIRLELKPGLSASELDLLGRHGARLEGIGARVVAFTLADMADRGVNQELGYPSATMYGEIRLGQAPSTARERLAIGRSLRDLPLIDKAFREERLCWSQVRDLARVCTAETEGAWVSACEGRTARETVALTRGREKGDLPADPVKRRIHTSTFKVQGLLNVVQMEMWNNARAKVEAARGVPVSDTEMLLEAATLLLTMTPDGSVPGWRPVNDFLFKVVVQHDAGSGESAVATTDGPVPLDEDTAAAVLREAGREDLVGAAAAPRPVPAPAPTARDARAAPPPVPPSQRDRPTPAWMRRLVLLRDGLRCRLSGSKQSLAVDHIEERRHGGRTEPRNLNTLDENCHSLKTDGLVKIKCDAERGLRYTDRAGRDLLAPGEATGLVLAAAELEGTGTGMGTRDARAARRTLLVSFDDLPEECDADWFATHGHLLKWNETRGVYDFEPGYAAPAVPSAPRACGTVAEARAARPQHLCDFVGQERAIKNLDLAVRVARREGTPVRHTLLYGPPGLGKTSLAAAVAAELASGFHFVNGPTVRRPGALLELLTSLQQRDVLFIDEIHRLPIRVAEALYEALEDRRLSLLVSCGHRKRTLGVRLRPFTLIGATTDPEKIPGPLLGRFGIRARLEFYGIDELVAILRRAAARAGLNIDEPAARLLAGVARQTPREALALFDSSREDAADRGCVTIDEATARETLVRHGIDEQGLRPEERDYLGAMGRGPVSKGTLAARLGVSVRTLLHAIEPHLLRRRLVEITRRGRALPFTNEKPLVEGLK